MNWVLVITPEIKKEKISIGRQEFKNSCSCEVLANSFLFTMLYFRSSSVPQFHWQILDMTFGSRMILDVPVHKTFSPDENNEYKAH